MIYYYLRVFFPYRFLKTIVQRFFFSWRGGEKGDLFWVFVAKILSIMVYAP